MVRPVGLQHIREHQRNPSSPYSNGFVHGWFSHRRKAAPVALIGGLVVGWLLGLATYNATLCLWGLVQR